MFVKRLSLQERILIMTERILKNIINSSKRTATQRLLLQQFINQGAYTIPELAKLLDISIPTVTKVLNELIDLGLIKEVGKREINAGRIPTVYDLIPESGYFLGIDPRTESLWLGLSDFCGNLVYSQQDIPYHYTDSAECLQALTDAIATFVEESGIEKENILHACMNVSGRVNPYEGKAYNLFTFLDHPLAEALTNAIGIPTIIDNDTRCMTYGELLRGACKGKKNVLFINVSWGLGMGIVIDGNLYFGKSGYSGEIGHMRTYNNGIICHCGKIGCMETEVSGRALQRQLTQRLKDGEQSILSQKALGNGGLSLDDILNGIRREDTICIDALQKMADELGKNLSSIINVFNPEMLVLGGELSVTGDYLIQPISMSIKKYSLNIVNEDSKIVTSILKDKAGLIGACLMARHAALSPL